MKRVKAGFPLFSILLLISLLIFFFFQNPLTGILQLIMLPVQKSVYMSGTRSTLTTSQLQQENNQLRQQLAQMQELQRNNQALNDQFKTTIPEPQSLLPADVVGLAQNALYIDKGEKDGIRLGDIVVVNNNLIGTVGKITPHISLVKLLSDPTTSFTANTVKTSADGIVGSVDGGNVILANVVLSQKLEINDIVVTKGTLNAQAEGYPPNLVVGKIVSVDKQASSLFQAAKLQSLVNISQIQMVFVITQ